MNSIVTKTRKFPIENNPAIFKDVICAICLSGINDKTAACCNRCLIYMHSQCHSVWNGNVRYTKCINCIHIGSIGTVYNYDKLNIND